MAKMIMKRPSRAIKWLNTLEQKHRGTAYSIWGLKAVLKYIEYLENKLHDIEEKGESDESLQDKK